MSEVKLLPLPEHMKAWARSLADDARAYARASMEPLIAENERLRAEVISAKNTSAYQWQATQEANKRAERLAEALRIAEAALADIGDADREPGDDVEWCERRAALGLRVVRAALDQEGGKGGADDGN